MSVLEPTGYKQLINNYCFYRAPWGPGPWFKAGGGCQWVCGLNYCCEWIIKDCLLIWLHAHWLSSSSIMPCVFKETDHLQIKYFNSELWSYLSIWTECSRVLEMLSVGICCLRSNIMAFGLCCPERQKQNTIQKKKLHSNSVSFQKSQSCNSRRPCWENFHVGSTPKQIYITTHIEARAIVLLY